MSSASPTAPVAHVRPAEGEAQTLLALQRVMLWMRLLGVGLFVSQVALYDRVNVGLVAVATVIVLGTIGAQLRILPDGLPTAVIRRRSLGLLAGDLSAVYLVGTAFAPSADWLGFYFYPLLAVEAAVIAGLWGGVAVTVLSTFVFLAQTAIHAAAGNPVTLPETLGGIALITFTGGFMAVFGRMVEHGQRDMRVLLDLTSALAHQRDEAETIELLDRRLHDAVGARVRSIAIRNDDGQFEIVRWHSTERRVLDRAAIEASIGDLETLMARFRAGTALTWTTDPDSPITRFLGLPEWARSVTLVPIVAEGTWTGILPVLWAHVTVPDARQLRLLYGVASQMGLALSQGRLQRVRQEAATDQLTRLLNRRAILDELGAAVARAERSGSAMSVLFCDLDGFKAVNDARGHEAGDAVLRAVAAAVRGALRQGDAVGRYGGDELLVLAADAGPDDAMTLAGRIGDAVRAAAGAMGVDVTIGIAVHPDDGRTSAAMLGAADRAMYRGKLIGPGRIVLAGERAPGEPEPVAPGAVEPDADQRLAASA